MTVGAHKGGVLKSRIASANDYNRFDYQFQDPGTNLRQFPTARFDWNITRPSTSSSFTIISITTPLPTLLTGKTPWRPEKASLLAIKPAARSIAIPSLMRPRIAGPSTAA